MTPCKHPGCNRPHEAKGYCASHYAQLKRRGTTWDLRSDGKKPLCSVPGCTNVARARGLCGVHYGRFIRHGTFDLQPRLTKLQQLNADLVKAQTCYDNAIGMDCRRRWREEVLGIGRQIKRVRRK